MIFVDASEERERFLRPFQGLQESHKGGDSLLGTVLDPRFPGAVVPVPESPRRDYYALAETSKDWTNLVPLLRAFVGKTVTDFDGALRLPGDDPIEELVDRSRFHAITRFRAHPGQERTCSAALTRLTECLARSPVREPVRPRSTTEVLEEFRMALAIQDRDAARSELQYLRDHLLLDALNLNFLEVQLEASLEDWEGLLGKGFLHDLCETRRPPAVTAALVQALYHGLVEPAEEKEGPEGALLAFKSSVWNGYSRLFVARPPSPNHTVAKMFLLAALSCQPVDVAGVLATRDEVDRWPEGQRTGLESLLRLADSAVKNAGADVAPGSSWSTVNLALVEAERESGPPSPETARGLLVTALNLQTLEAYRVACEYVNRLEPLVREALLSNQLYSALWQGISKSVNPDRVPNGWAEWIQALERMTFEQANSSAEKAKDEWPIEQHLDSPAAVMNLIRALDSVESDQRLFSEALPAFVSWVRSDVNWPNPAYLELYDRLLTHLILSGRRSNTSLEAMFAIAEGMLTVGLQPVQYEELLKSLQDLVKELDGRSYIDALIDLAELVSTYACPLPRERERLWAAVIAVVSRFKSTLTRKQKYVLSDLASLLGVDAGLAGLLDSPEGGESVLELPKGYMVAIYSLTDTVARRTADTLKRLYPTLNVETDNSSVSTNRLVELARSADLFVVCWRSAKHSATGAISQNRPASRLTIFPVGKGSSSILNDVEEHLVKVAAVGRA